MSKVSPLKKRQGKFVFLPQDLKEADYKSLVRPILEHGISVWDPHCNGLNYDLENVQKRAARFVTRSYRRESCIIAGILEELKWETPQKRRKDNRLILLYKGLKGKAKIPKNDLNPQKQTLQKSTLNGLSDTLC